LKALDDAQSLFGYVLQTKLSFCILFLFSITCTSITGGIMMNGRQSWWCNNHYQGWQNAKRASRQMYVRGLRSLC